MLNIIFSDCSLLKFYVIISNIHYNYLLDFYSNSGNEQKWNWLKCYFGLLKKKFLFSTARNTEYNFSFY